MVSSTTLQLDDPAMVTYRNVMALTRRTPLARGSSQLKRTELVRSSKPMRQRSAKTAKADVEYRRSCRIVDERSGGMCEVRADGCTGRAEHHHHRKMRSAGVDHSPANILAACSFCHHAAHHASERYVMGWLLHSWETP